MIERRSFLTLHACIYVIIIACHVTMRNQQLVVLVVATLTVISLYGTRPTTGAAAMISARECGLNPMHPIQMVSQKTGKREMFLGKKSPLSDFLSALI